MINRKKRCLSLPLTLSLKPFLFIIIKRQGSVGERGETKKRAEKSTYKHY
jgi:hypothetical protein